MVFQHQQHGFMYVTHILDCIDLDTCSYIATVPIDTHSKINGMKNMLNNNSVKVGDRYQLHVTDAKNTYYHL